MDEEPITLADVGKPGLGNKRAPGYEIPEFKEPATAPLYRVKFRTFIHNRLYEPGETLRYADKPGPALELVTDEPHPAEPVQKRGPGRPRIDKSVI
jgi:hypothetical protein